MDTSRRRLAAILLLVCLHSLHTAHSCAPVFLVEPKSVVVSEGESASFSCVLAELSVNEWFINGTDINATVSISHSLSHDNYAYWSGCTHGSCGGTLFVKSVDESLNGSYIMCQVIHDTCNEKNASMSRPALIIVRGHKTSGSTEETQSLSFSAPSSTALSPSPSPNLKPPEDTKPPDSSGKSAETDKTTMQVTERLVQRVPLMAGAAGVCFVVGCVFGTLCAVTIGRGTSRRRTHKHRTRRRRREDVYITPPVQSQSDPNYAELSPVRVTTVASSSTASSASSTSSAGSTGSSNSASNSSSDASTTNMNSSVGGDQASGGSDGRRENDYTELGMPDIPQFHRPNGTTNSVGLREIATNVGDPCRDSSSGPPLPPRGQPTNCETCIDMDLDELERVVLQQ